MPNLGVRIGPALQIRGERIAEIVESELVFDPPGIGSNFDRCLVSGRVPLKIDKNPGFRIYRKNVESRSKRKRKAAVLIPRDRNIHRAVAIQIMVANQQHTWWWQEEGELRPVLTNPQNVEVNRLTYIFELNKEEPGLRHIKRPVGTAVLATKLLRIGKRSRPHIHFGIAKVVSPNVKTKLKQDGVFGVDADRHDLEVPVHLEWRLT